MIALVTGGAGFIGSHIVGRLLATGHGVRVLDNFSTGKSGNLADLSGELEIVEGDIRSLNLLQAARECGVGRVVFASSSSIYGNNPVLPKHEGMIPEPLSPYAVSKLAGEHYMQVFFRLYGLETVCLRYFNVFGPRQDPTSQYSAVIPRFIQAMLQGERPTIHGDGEQSRDFTYVDNVVHANLLAATAETGVAGGVFNAACHDRITLNQLVATLNRVLGAEITPHHSEPRLGDVRHSFAAIDKLRSAVGYEPLIDFEEGIGRTVASFVNRAALGPVP
jgi:UDP-glucose 4-epimerase